MKLYRSGPKTATVDAATLNILGELEAKVLKVDGVPIDQLIQKILKEIVEKDQE